MISYRRMGANTPSACLARARLLHDVAHTRFNEPQPRRSTLSAGLSPDDQTRYAIQIARNFKQHYLTEVVYLNEKQMVAATIKPISAADIPHTIYVDINGNVDVSYDFTNHAGQRRISRLVLLTGSALLALIALFTSALMTIV